MGVSAEEVNKNFGYFIGGYPSPENRFAYAYSLADPAAEKAGDPTYASRTFLLAHWGEDKPELQKIHKYMSVVKAGVGSMVGQPIMIINRGSLDDIASIDPDDEQLSADAEILFGFVAADELYYRFGGRVALDGTVRRGVPSPYLTMEMSVPVRHAATIKVDVVGDGKVVPRPNMLMAPVYQGTVPLRFDLGLYHARKKYDQATAVLGPKKCQPVLAALNRKSSPQVQKELSNLSLRPHK